MRKFKSGAVAVTLLLLGACAQSPGAPVVYFQDVTPSYTPGLVNYAAGQGGLVVDFPNLPFAQPPESSIPILLNAMKTPRIGYSIPLLAAPPPDVTPGLRIKVLLDAAPRASARALCAEGSQALGSTGPRMEVILAACRGPKMVAYSRGSLYPPATPADPALGELLRSMVVLTLPNYDPNRSGDRNRLWKHR